MQIITLYKYNRADGGVTVSPVKPEGEYTEMYRLVADEGKALTQDGENLTTCIDTDTPEGWYEVYDEAIDIEGAPYIYEETDMPIEAEPEEKEE
jgi:hypothetical protein